MNFALKTAADTVLAYTTGRAGGAPGVVAMATNLSANVYAGCAGVRGLGKPQAMALDSVMAIFSTTKSLTGTAVMQLVEEGRSRLDDAAKIDAPEIAQNQVLTGFDNRRPAEMDTGGHGLYASVGDYMTFIRLFLNDGAGPHGRVLQADTVDAMCRNGLPAGMLSGGWTTPIPSLSNDGEFDPGGPKTWADTFQRNEAPSASGRPAGSVSWAGLGWAICTAGLTAKTATVATGARRACHSWTPCRIRVMSTSRQRCTATRCSRARPGASTTPHAAGGLHAAAGVRAGRPWQRRRIDNRADATRCAPHALPAAADTGPW